MRATRMNAGSQGREISLSISAPMSRRTFLAGATAVAVSVGIAPRIAYLEVDAPAFLHLAACSAGKGQVHTYDVTGDRCELLATTSVDSLAACASHPALPIVYIARDCGEWEHLPRGVVETYQVERSAHPLRLILQTPMALSATGPRSLTVSNCGRYLLVSASTGRAWNAFVLDSDGVPASVAIARKETGTVLHSQTISLPAPHAAAFSPTGLYAVGTDPGSERITLLQPSPDGIAILSRCRAPFGLAESSPAWTRDGRYLVAADAHTASLSLYAIRPTSVGRDGLEIHLVNTVHTKTSIKALLAHATEAGAYTSRQEGEGSRLEFWRVRGDRLRVECDTWIADNVLAFARHADSLWLVSEDRLIEIRCQDLHAIRAVKVAQSLQGLRGLVIQKYQLNLI
jgi:Lactonase, 7-bladed beta-propeller